MRIGIAITLQGLGDAASPTWVGLREQALTAERIGCDIVVVEDALSYPDPAGTVGLWESVVIMGALAASTSTVGLGHSVVNAVYRSPGHLAKIAETIDEVSCGRYTLGLGAGNTPDEDYAAFGFPSAHRVSRFEEGVQIVHGLLKRGEVDFRGTYYSAEHAEMVLRGPRPQGPPLVIAAGGARMMRLAARYADGWNWWAMPHPEPDDVGRTLAEVDRACEAEDRDPGTLTRSLDLYLPVTPAGSTDEPDSEQTADALLALGQLGVDEVRCYLPRRTSMVEAVDAVAAFEDVVRAVHAG
jgi:alkanesulfonate monooxygenase SsuD/methylene tetrahydromethanopterin reductase-like flavin-dependent oxidoreductase (luciferase family)